MEDKSIDAAVDHLSKLPEPILQKILTSLLVKNAAGMSTLSETLYSAWSSLSYLNFGDNFLYYAGESGKSNIPKFAKIVDQTLANRQTQKVSMQKFWLIIPSCLIWSSYFHNWIKTLVACKIKELILRIYINVDGDNTLPEEIFDAKELEVLKLDGFKLELPYERDIKLSSLRELKLSNTFLDEHFIRALCGSCNCLEGLTLDECQGLASLQIVGTLPKLKRVWLNFPNETKMLDIVAPNLENLHIRNNHWNLLKVNGITHCKALKSLYFYCVGVIDQGLEDIVASLPNLEALYLLSCPALKKLKISSDRLEFLVLEECFNLIVVVLDTPNLTSFSYTCYERRFPALLLINASVLLKVELKMFQGQNTLDRHWYSKLVKFLGNFKQSKAIHLECDSEKLIVIPKGMRKNLVPPHYGTDCLHIEFERTKVAHNYSVVEVLDSLLWIAPQLDSLSLLRYNLKSTLKFIYDDAFEDEKTSCASLLLKRPRHNKLKEVKMENFGCMDQQKLRDYLSHMKAHYVSRILQKCRHRIRVGSSKNV